MCVYMCVCVREREREWERERESGKKEDYNSLQGIVIESLTVNQSLFSSLASVNICVEFQNTTTTKPFNLICLAHFKCK